MIRIVPHTKPLNHRMWTLIYVLTILFSLMFAPYAKGETTNKVTTIQWVEYHNRLLENYVQYLRMRQLLYGKKKAKKEIPKLLEIPEPQPSPSQADFEVQTRKHRDRRLRLQLTAASLKASPRLARSLRRQDLRGSNRTPPQSPS